jgi:hypothetical protein
MAKGLAVSQIILLVLGIIVLAVIAYLLYANFIGPRDVINAEQCRSSAIRACTTCSIAGGATGGCSGNIYLDATGKRCVLQGLIIGEATKPLTASEDSVTKAITVTGDISCSSYTGGNECTESPPNCNTDTETLQCKDGNWQCVAKTS